MDADQDFKHHIRINWHKEQGAPWWNDTCAMVLSVFGLPGQRFIYHPFEDYMEFLFKSEKDATMCRILLSERL